MSLQQSFAAEDANHAHQHGASVQPPPAHNGEGHSHEGAEEKVAQVTLWTDDFEFFIEHRLLVVDNTTKFVTHITHVDTWEPRKEGTVTFVLRHGDDKPIEQVVEAPEREGIYIPTLTFPKAGEWNVSLVIPRNGQNRVVELPPFHVYESLDEAFHANPSEPPDGIPFLKEQQWKVITATSPVVRRAMTEHLSLVGTISPCPEKRASVVPPLSGRILAPQGGNLPRIGDRVEAGQVLALIQPPLAGPDLLSFLNNQTQIQSLQAEITAKAAEAEAEAARSSVTLASAQRLAERIRPLRDSNAKSAREVEEAEFALQKAQTDVASAEKLKQTYEKVLAQLASKPSSIHVEDGFPTIDLKAPISGTVVEVNAASGENIPVDRMVFGLLDSSSVFLEARMPESKLGQLTQSLNASFEVSEAPGVLLATLGEGGGRLVYVGSAVDPQSRTAPIIYEVPNPDGRLRIGMSVTVHLETKHTEEGLAVPKSALVDADGRFAAYVQVSGESFQKRDLETGIFDNGYVQILSGLSEGERVVTKGAYAIRLASVSTSIPAHGHAH
jgi:RND family efflux transporter MFP subunit